MYYFAYGSNMSLNRLKERDVRYIDKFLGHLQNYELIFNKVSSKRPSYGFANVIPNKGSTVEGIIFKMEDGEISKLDKFEKYPRDYRRETSSVFSPKYNKYFKCVIYVAQPMYIKEDLIIPLNYIQYIVEGARNNVSWSYYEKLLEYKKEAK